MQLSRLKQKRNVLHRNKNYPTGRLQFLNVNIHVEITMCKSYIAAENKYSGFIPIFTPKHL